MPPVCRLLPFAVADGPHNMAADEALLESAAAGVASLRFYGWSEATVSLGYFQPERIRQRDPRLAPLPFVRRPSGGATLVHDYEVTYALALPAGQPWQTEERWLRRMHEIVASALKQLGLEVQAIPDKSEQRYLGTLLCFLQLMHGDLAIGWSKVVGSAQRKRRGALMQHGSILLAASPFTPSLPGIRELSGRTLTIEETCEAVRSAFARQTGWNLEPSDWTGAERRRIEELAAAKYGHDTWNRKR